MRKRKTVRLDEREITVWELRVRDIRELMERAEKLPQGTAADLLDQLPGLLPLATDLDPSSFEELAPSELRLLWEAFKEVNSDFFGLLQKAGVKEAVAEVLRGRPASTPGSAG